MRLGTPSLAINGSKEIGLFVGAISSLYIRLRYSKHLALGKNLFAVYRGHPIVQEAGSSVRGLQFPVGFGRRISPFPGTAYAQLCAKHVHDIHNVHRSSPLDS